MKPGLFAVLRSQKWKDRTAGPVFSGLGPVQLRSFSSLETGPLNTTFKRSCWILRRSGTRPSCYRRCYKVIWRYSMGCDTFLHSVPIQMPVFFNWIWCSLLFADDLKEEAITYETQTFNGHFEDYSKYQGPPNPGLDEMWRPISARKCNSIRLWVSKHSLI